MGGVGRVQFGRVGMFLLWDMRRPGLLSLATCSSVCRRSMSAGAGIPLVTDTNTRLLPEGKGDISDPANRCYIVKVFGEHVFKKLAVCLRLTGERTGEETPGAALLKTPSEKQHVHLNAF